MLSVTGLTIYPVKSLAPVHLQSARVEAFGLQHDRRWMVVDTEGRFVSQRRVAEMCLIKQQLIGNGLRLWAPDGSSIDVDETLTETLRVSVWGDTCAGRDCGDNAAAWLSHTLGLGCRLVWFDPNEVRSVDQSYGRPGDKTAFSDGFPILLTTDASLADLNSRMQQPVAMARFRPNIVVGGNTPFAEDEWKKLRIGNTTFRVVKPCSRCIIPNIDPTNGNIEKEPGRTLATFRKRGNEVFFGQNVIADGEGVIEVGMGVEVLD